MNGHDHWAESQEASINRKSCDLLFGILLGSEKCDIAQGHTVGCTGKKRNRTERISSAFVAPLTAESANVLLIRAKGKIRQKYKSCCHFAWRVRQLILWRVYAREYSSFSCQADGQDRCIFSLFLSPLSLTRAFTEFAFT